jgi:N-glycosylase/DNA lyase
MIVKILDDFDLLKIAESGQCFRVKQFDDVFRFITQHHIIYISKLSDTSYSVSCTENEWERIWSPYFDLKRRYSDLIEQIPPSDLFLKRAVKEGTGIRILVQDRWETLISFIISQRKSIPSIKDSIEELSKRFGHSITTPYETVYTFPTPEDMLFDGVTSADLRNCKVGYRADYILSALSYVHNGEFRLDSMSELNDEDLFNRLLEIRGVGNKVASCVCLFSYHRTSFAPIDTWIQKVIDVHYHGVNPLNSFGNNAGIMQQYIFYYTQKHKDDFKHG